MKRLLMLLLVIAGMLISAGGCSYTSPQDMRLYLEDEISNRAAVKAKAKKWTVGITNRR